MSKKRKSLTLEELEKRLRRSGNDLMLGYISRVELVKRGGGMFNIKTLRNHDSQGIGPRGKISGRRGLVYYPIEGVLEYVAANFYFELEE